MQSSKILTGKGQKKMLIITILVLVIFNKFNIYDFNRFLFVGFHAMAMIFLQKADLHCVRNDKEI
jgi:hypothetical protein